MAYEYEDENEVHFYGPSQRKHGRPLGKGAPHYPNTAERKLLTQMMQKSGQTEEQVRAEKSNRQKLAAAAKSMSTGKGRRRRLELELKRVRRRIASNHNLPVWHPDVEKYLLDKNNARWGSLFDNVRRKVFGV